MICPECEEGTLICLGVTENRTFEYECNVCFVIKEYDGKDVIRISEEQYESYRIENEGEPK